MTKEMVIEEVNKEKEKALKEMGIEMEKMKEAHSQEVNKKEGEIRVIKDDY